MLHTPQNGIQWLVDDSFYPPWAQHPDEQSDLLLALQNSLNDTSVNVEAESSDPTAASSHLAAPVQRPTAGCSKQRPKPPAPKNILIKRKGVYFYEYAEMKMKQGKAASVSECKLLWDNEVGKKYCYLGEWKCAVEEIVDLTATSTVYQ